MGISLAKENIVIAFKIEATNEAYHIPEQIRQKLLSISDEILQLDLSPGWRFFTNLKRFKAKAQEYEELFKKNGGDLKSLGKKLEEIRDVERASIIPGYKPEVKI